jgi:metallo-beta-lactamase class B
MTGPRHLARRLAALSLKLVTAGLIAGAASAAAPDIDAMNQPHKPFQIYGNTYYVGMSGIASVLVTSEYGHVLIDAGLPESAAQIARNIQELGFKLEDVKGIVFSHAHPDHVGGIAELQRLTGAQVYALRPAQGVLVTGKLPKDDPQYSTKSEIPKVKQAWIVTDEQLLGIGGLRLRVYATPGHTPGSATWTWDACDGSNCLDFVYSDSLSPVSAGKYKFKDHPDTLAGFEKSFKTLESIPCELFLMPHPDAAALARLEQAKGDAEKLKQESACKDFAKQRRDALAQRLATER